ncbi:MAG: nucleotidyl transferase AbiEii/AbiGii toxin family protein [Patescibacteria group bacterium]
MLNLCTSVLDKNRLGVFNNLKNFEGLGYLAGGTAIALQLEHRYSYDFDIFTDSPLSRNVLIKARDVFGTGINPTVDSSDELSFVTAEGVKVSFIHFPFPPLHKLIFTKSISLASLKDMASNKAYVIGRRGEYRDYVDMFFLLKSGITLATVVKDASKRFKGAFSERLFLEQLVFFKDIEDYEIGFIGKAYSPQEVLKFFQNKIEEK